VQSNGGGSPAYARPTGIDTCDSDKPWLRRSTQHHPVSSFDNASSEGTICLSGSFFQLRIPVSYNCWMTSNSEVI
jgi:hypothetical protein